MRKKISNLSFLITISLILNHCANRGTTTGGDKDETPPVIISSKPENFSINFDATEIEIKFDEYVKLKNLQKQLIISPPMNFEPDFSNEPNFNVTSIYNYDLKNIVYHCIKLK